MGLPLMSYTIKTALDSELFDRVIVSTNDKETSEIASQLGAEVPFLRPDIISSNLSADIQWVRLAIDDWLNLDDKDIFSILRPTNPLRKSNTIRKAMKLFEETTDADCLRAVRPVKEHPGKMWMRSQDGFISPYLSANSNSGQSPMHSSPIQDLFEIWVQDASLEITTAGFVRLNNLIAGGKIIGYEMPGWEGFDVNYPEDLEYLKFLVTSGLASL